MKNNGHIEHDNLIFEYNEITPLIYIGTNMCCQTHFDAELLELGVKANISLEANKLDTPFGVDFYLWLPTEDLSAPTEDQLELGVTTLDKLIKLKNKIYVHCRFGHGRAPTLVAAYFISQGMSVEDAILKIKEKRSSIHISETQKEALKKFKEQL